MSNEEKKVKEQWDKLWEKSEQKKFYFDETSEKILDTIKEIVKDIKGKKILEIGSGTGKISLMLAKQGAEVYLLDIAPKAIENTKRLFNDMNEKGNFICASMFKIPFEDESFDIVWSSGVLEHFSKKKQTEALEETLRICKPGGFSIVYVPSARGVFYRIGKKTQEIFKRWTVGYEKPEWSLKRMKKHFKNVELKEKNIDFTNQLIFLWPGFLSRGFLKFFRKIVNPKNEKNFIKIFGGYLLMSAFKKLKDK